MQAHRAFLIATAGIGLLSVSSGFPVPSLTVSSTTFAALNSTGSHRDSLATNTLLPALQDIFKRTEYAIEVEQGDLVIQSSFPDEQIDGNCHHKIDAEHLKATGTIEKSSFLKFGIANVSWHGATIFTEGEFDAKLDINLDTCVRTGVEIFGHHCSQVARKTVGMDVLSDGKVGVGINMTAYNAHIAKINGTWSLVLNFHASVVGTVMTWNIDKVTADNCKIKILGITIASVCGFIESHVKDEAQKLTDHVTTVTAPNLLKKLEAKVNTAIGSEVVIPLRIADAVSDEPGNVEVVI